MTISNPNSWMGWMSRGGALLVVIAAVAAVTIQSTLGASWRNVIMATVVLLGIQLAALAGMFWSKNQFKSRRDPAPAFAIFAIYAISMGSALIYFARRLNLLREQRGRVEYVWFAASVIVVTLLAHAVFKGVKRQP